MRRRDLLKLAAAAPLGLLPRRSPPIAPAPLRSLTLRVKPIVVPAFITREMLADVQFDLVGFLEAEIARTFRGVL